MSPIGINLKRASSMSSFKYNYLINSSILRTFICPDRICHRMRLWANTTEFLASPKGPAMSEAQDTRPDAAKDAVEGWGQHRANAKISLPRVLALLRPYRWQLIAAAILLVITDGLGLLYPLVIRSLLNTILSHHNAGLLNLVVVFLLIVFVLQAAFGAL